MSMSMPLLGVGRPSGPVYRLRDTFTGVDGTLLSAHAMEVGPGWTEDVSEAYQLAGNKATTSSALFKPVYADAGAGGADGVLDVDIVGDFTSGAAYWLPGLALRVAGLLSFNFIEPYAGGVKLYEYTGGYTQRASAAQATVTGVTYHYKVTLAGASISLEVDGVAKFTYASSAFNLTATAHGLEVEKGGAPTTQPTWDNFTFT